MEPRTIKMPEDLWAFLGTLAEELGYDDPRGLHSRLVREMVSAAATKWQESPYVARSAKNVVLVTRDGHLFYRQVQVLKLNKKRDRLPCLLDLHASRRADIKGKAWLQPRWLLNHFAVWQGEGDKRIADEPLDAWVDREGTDAKTADLVVNKGPERILTREIVAGLREYVQWKGKQREDDRVDFPIDIPTLNLEIIVIVDAELYRESAKTEADLQQIANLKVELRNRELARFEADVFGRDSFNRMSPLVLGKCLGGTSDPEAEKPRKRAYQPEAEMRKTLDDLKTRIEFLAQAKTKSGGAIVLAKERAYLLDALKLPKSFLYYKLGWPSPYFGVEVGIQWEKPEKPK